MRSVRLSAVKRRLCVFQQDVSDSDEEKSDSSDSDEDDETSGSSDSDDDDDEVKTPKHFPLICLFEKDPN